MTDEERQRFATAALRAGEKHLPRLHWEAYSALPGAFGTIPRDVVHVSLEWRPGLVLGVGAWDCRVHVHNLQVAQFVATSPGGGAVDARDVLCSLRNELTAALRPKRARRSDAG